jgi:hypothetical protein
MVNETPTLAETIKTAIDSELVNFNTCLPGIVEKYNAATKTADIQPAIKRKYTKDNSLVSLPVIPNVPMCFFQTRTSLISVPVKAGDDVLLVFSERSIDNWKSSVGGAQVDPADIRKFALSDAFAIPICKPLGTGVPAEGEPIFINNIDSIGRFHEDGQIKHENPIAYVDIKANGDVEIKNAIVTATFFNSGKIEIKNAISTYTMEAAGKNELKNTIATIKEDADGTITLVNTNGSIVIAAAGGITATTPSGTMTMGSGGSINMTTPNSQIDMDVAGKVELGKSTATQINLGSGAQPVLLGNTLVSIFNAHVHPDPVSGNTGAPTTTMNSALSAKVNTE